MKEALGWEDKTTVINTTTPQTTINNLETKKEAYNKEDAVLLKCKNASLTNKEFRCRVKLPTFWDKFENTCWHISDMTMAIVEDNGSLGIIFKDGTKRDFKLSLSTGTALSATGLILFGGVGSMIAGNMAIKNQIKATSQQWATAINMLISKGKVPEMIYCKFCGTKNKSDESKCLHCGAILT